MPDSLTTFCPNCSRRYDTPTFWCESCQALLPPGHEWVEKSNQNRKRLQQDTLQLEWLLEKVPNWVSCGEISFEEEKSLGSIIQRLKKNRSIEIDAEDELASCLIEIRVLLLSVDGHTGQLSKIKNWLNRPNFSLPNFYLNIFEKLCSKLEKKEKNEKENYELVQQLKSSIVYDKLNVSQKIIVKDSIEQSQKNHSPENQNFILSEFAQPDLIQTDHLAKTDHGSPQFNPASQTTSHSNPQESIVSRNEEPIPFENQFQFSPSDFLKMSPPPIPTKPAKIKKPLISPHWKEGTSKWIKALKPFVIDNVGWFVGGFLVLAGFSYLIATLWNTLGQNPVLWRSFVFFCLFCSTGGFAFLGFFLLKKHPNLEVSGMVFLTIGTLMFPLVMACAMMIALLPPYQEIETSHEQDGTSQVNH